jgi:YD repeat-containing protein
MPYTKAQLLHSLKLVNAEGIEERKIWAVPVDEKNPDGIRYRLAYIPAGRKIPEVLYDNHHPKGHHKHVEDRQYDYAYTGLENLILDFCRDIEALK